MGTNASTTAVCAIKKSRASLRLKRTLLKYEASLLAIKLLGKSLSDKDKSAPGFSMQEVSDIGVQLVRCSFL